MSSLISFNTLDPDMKFTIEGEEEGELECLDTISVRKEDDSLKVTIYLMETHILTNTPTSSQTTCLNTSWE